MKKIGNYKNWIPEGLLDTILKDSGDIVPVYQPEKWKGKPEWDRARIELENAGYPDLNYKFHQYTIKEVVYRNAAGSEASFFIEWG